MTNTFLSFRRVSWIFFTFLTFPLCLFATSDPLVVIVNYAKNLSAYAKTGDIEYRIALDETTPSNCLVNDVVAQHIVRENQYTAGTLRVADYYNAIEKWREKGELRILVDDITLQKNIKIPGETSMLGGEPLQVVIGSLLVRGPVKLTDRVLYFVRGNKITKIISSSDKTTLGKGIELYSNKNYNAAFKLFRELAHSDRSNYMAQYWTAVMELHGEGCKHIHPNIRKQEAIWWLSRGREKGKEFLKSSWKEHVKEKKDDISYTNFVLKYGENLFYNVYPEAIGLMTQAYNEANITSADNPFADRDDYTVLVSEYKPITHGLMMNYNETTDLYGFVNEQNEPVIPCKYRMAYPFSKNGLAQVTNLDGKKGFINTKGEEVIPCIYDRLLTSFIGHTTFAIKDGYLLVVTDKNEVIRRISGYNKLAHIELDKYVVILDPQTNKGNLFDGLGNIIERNIDRVINNIFERWEVIKDGRSIYMCYLNWK